MCPGFCPHPPLTRIDSLAFFVFNNNICKNNAYKMCIYKALEPTFNHSHSICPLILFCINGIKSRFLLSDLALLSNLFLLILFFASILQSQNYSFSNESIHSSSFSFDIAFLSSSLCYSLV